MRREVLPLLAVPFADIVAGVPVRDAALALDGVQEIDPVGRRLADRQRGFQQLFLPAGEGESSCVASHG